MIPKPLFQTLQCNVSTPVFILQISNAVFIDEIDSLAPDRSKVEGEVEKRLVAQLLSLMDGFAQTKGVIVLTATNRLEHLDPALRRPGRFDREIQFRVPNRQGRLEILQILTGSIPVDGTVNLEGIADLTVGFVGADLKALCQKSAYNALRRYIPSLEGEIPDSMTVNQLDFLSHILLRPRVHLLPYLPASCVSGFPGDLLLSKADNQDVIDNIFAVSPQGSSLI